MPRAWTPPRAWPVRDPAQYQPLTFFIPYERNARTHPQKQIDVLAALIEKHGPDQPIVVDDARLILKGHGRLLAAQQAGLTHFTFIQRLGLTEDEKKAMRLADNQVSLLSGWDKALIAPELSELKLAGYDMSLLGFPEAQLRGWGVPISTTRETPPDETPEPPRNPVVRLGEVWELGGHRIICGDSTDRGTVEKLIGNRDPKLMVTDPPYGIDYDPADRDRMTGIETANSRRGRVENDDRADWTASWKLFKGDVAYVWCASLTRDVVLANLRSADFALRSEIIWAKQQITFGRGDYHWQHEPCLYVVRKGRAGHWNGGRQQSTLWNDIASLRRGDDASTEHGTQKPVECMKRGILNNSVEGSWIYDPFSGSGTTLIACEDAGRRALVVELSPAYVELAIERWQRFSGKKAKLGGRNFDDLAAERRAPARRGRVRAAVAAG